MLDYGVTLGAMGSKRRGIDDGLSGPQYWFLDGSRQQQLFLEGRLARLRFGWEMHAIWRLTCDTCGRDFEHGNALAKYCSTTCKREGQRRLNRERQRRFRERQRAH